MIHKRDIYKLNTPFPFNRLTNGEALFYLVEQGFSIFSF